MCRGRTPTRPLACRGTVALLLDDRDNGTRPYSDRLPISRRRPHHKPIKRDTREWKGVLRGSGRGWPRDTSQDCSQFPFKRSLVVRGWVFVYGGTGDWPVEGPGVYFWGGTDGKDESWLFPVLLPPSPSLLSFQSLLQITFSSFVQYKTQEEDSSAPRDVEVESETPSRPRYWNAVHDHCPRNVLLSRPKSLPFASVHHLPCLGRKVHRRGPRGLGRETGGGARGAGEGSLTCRDSLRGWVDRSRGSR